MSTNYLLMLVLIFGASTVGIWVLMYTGEKGWIFYKNRFTSDARERLGSMFMFVDEQKLFVFNIVGMLFIPALVYLITQNVVYTVSSALMVIFLPKKIYKFLENKRVKEFETGLPDAIAQLAGAMRAGTTFPLAIETMVKETKGPISQEFSMVLREHRIGVTLEESLENMGERMPCQDLGLVITAALVAREIGGNLSEIFERLASTLREKAAMEGKINSLTSQGKLQGWVVGFLPIGMVLILFQMEPDAMAPLIDSVLGWCFIGVMAVLELLGMLLIKKIVTIDV